LIPATTCAFFVYDEQHDELFCAYSAGENSSHFADLTIVTGQRLSGWVAANRQTILNSDAALDLGEVARALRPALRSCLSTPLVFEKKLIGVLTLYSTETNAFNDEHLRLIEAIARQVAQPVRDAALSSAKTAPKQEFGARSGGAPNDDRGGSVRAIEFAAGDPTLLVLISVQPEVSRNSEEQLGAIATCLTAAYRDVYLIVQHERSRVVAIFSQTRSSSADAILSNVRDILSNGRQGESAISVGYAITPRDGNSISQLLLTAEAHSSVIPEQDSDRPSIH
jgi:putative methionine-R-sulfoxide reductase with GAF domain